MKRNRMGKRLLTALSALAMLLALTACGTGGSGEDGVCRVVIIKQMDHASLDEIAAAVAGRLDEIAAEQGVRIEYEITSGQGDQTILKQLGDRAIARGADVIVPIATTAAQVAALCAEDSATPVVYAAVSDPAQAGLTGLEHVTGISDALDVQRIMEMILTQNPDAQRIGLLYSLSEPNSAAPIAEAEEYLSAGGITCVKQTGNTGDEIIAAAAALAAAGVDAIFTPTDNIVMAAELAIHELLIEHGIPHYTGADSFARSGAFAACGVNYTQLGRDAAELAFRAATDGMEGLEEFYLASGGIITVNTDTAAALGLDASAFAAMGDVVEVSTTQQ